MSEFIYLRFVNFKRESSSPKGGLKKVVEGAFIKIMSTIIPRANPDFEHLLSKVEYWKIEYNTKKDATWREMGFDKNRNPVAAMPFGNNYGFWTDSQLTIDDYNRFDPSIITMEEFENNWIEFKTKVKN